MNRADLIAVCAARAGLTKAAASRVLSVLFDHGGAIERELARGGRVTIQGFGTFQTAVRAARKSRLPGQDQVLLGARTVAKFRAGKSLSDAVAK